MRGSRYPDAIGRARRRAAIAAGTLLVPLAAGVCAQQAPETMVNLGRIEVTGSNIRRIESESGLPLQVITSEELMRGGVQTAQDLLLRISANQSFGGFTEAMGEGSTLVGYTAASLRGLGAQRTLILLDGRRIAPYALSGGQSADLSGIPASAIERVEILKDGASAVYGTDAIGGVINFILRKDFTGAEVSGNYLATEHGGGNSARASATAGTGTLAQDRYNVFVSADYYKQDALRAAQRPSTRTSYLPGLGVDQTSPNSFPANITLRPHTRPVNPTIPATGADATSCAPPISFPTAKAPLSCQFDYASVIETIPETEKTNVVARFTWQADADTQIFAESVYYHGTATQRVSPTPASTVTSGTSITLPPTSPFYPGAFVASRPGGDPNAPIELNYRTIELGPRVDRVDVDQWNAVAGVQGRIRDWDYTLAANYTGNREVDHYESGFVYASRFGALMRSGVVNPFGRNDDATLALMRATQVKGPANDNRASNYGAEIKVSGNAYELPAGALAVAFGVEGRRESLEQTNADFVATGDVTGAQAVLSLPRTSRTVWSAFAEANVPITRTLEGDLAVRYDRYSDFGGTANPKLTLRWQPARSLLLRASYGSGFRAPTLSDLFQPQSVGGEVEKPDPLRCAVTQDSYDCDGLFPVKSGGNPALQPERSRQLSAGFVVEPAAALTASVDYYRINLTNAIDIVGVDAIFSDFAHWAPSYVVRGPPDAQFPNLPGPIAYVVQYSTNVGDIRTSGLDIDLRWRGPSSAVGRFDVELNGTYVLDYAHTGFASPAAASGVGTRGALGAIARYRHYAQVNWTFGPFGATLANTYQSGYRETDLLSCDEDGLDCTRMRDVGSYSIWDLQGRYTGWKNATLRLGVRNLLDRAPPLSNQTSAFQAGIDPSYADPRGRMYYVTVQYAFR